MDAGAELTLTVGDGYYWPARSAISWLLAVGTSVYAQVDSVHTGTSYGGVLESHERVEGTYNNILGTTVGEAQTASPTRGRHSAALPPRWGAREMHMRKEER